MSRAKIPYLMIAAIWISDLGSAQQLDTVGPVYDVPIVDTRQIETDYEGWALVVDNDLLASEGRDRDYSGGIAVSLHGQKAATLPFSLDPALSWLNRKLDFDGRLEPIT